MHKANRICLYVDRQTWIGRSVGPVTRVLRRDELGNVSVADVSNAKIESVAEKNVDMQKPKVPKPRSSRSATFFSFLVFVIRHSNHKNIRMKSQQTAAYNCQSRGAPLLEWERATYNYVCVCCAHSVQCPCYTWTHRRVHTHTHTLPFTSTQTCALVHLDALCTRTQTCSQRILLKRCAAILRVHMQAFKHCASRICT